MNTRAVHFEVDQAVDDLWFVRQHAANGEPEMFTETYAGRTSGESRGKAVRAASRMARRLTKGAEVITIGPDDEIVSRIYVGSAELR